jgi:hypothetical protein
MSKVKMRPYEVVHRLDTSEELGLNWWKIAAESRGSGLSTFVSLGKLNRSAVGETIFDMRQRLEPSLTECVTAQRRTGKMPTLPLGAGAVRAR